MSNKSLKDTSMKVYFATEELHTHEYKEYVKWVADVWRLNDEHNKRIAELGNPPNTPKTHKDMQ